MPGADLHLHSTASDGSDPPDQVARRALEVGLESIALTDHDSVGGVKAAQEVGREIGLEVFSGCELTAYQGDDEIHILGYGIDVESPDLLAHLETFRAGRRERLVRMLAQLAEADAPLDPERILAMATSDGAVGRVHVARALLEAGHVRTFPEAFSRFLSRGRPGYVAKLPISPERAIQVIHQAQGVAVLAHPAVGNQQGMVPALRNAGLDGIEVWHTLHRRDESETLFALAQRFGLLKTGGSDCHGVLPDRGPQVGTVRVDRGHVAALRTAIDRRHGNPP